MFLFSLVVTVRVVLEPTLTNPNSKLIQNSKGVIIFHTRLIVVLRFELLHICLDHVIKNGAEKLNLRPKRAFFACQKLQSQRYKN